MGVRVLQHLLWVGRCKCSALHLIVFGPPSFDLALIAGWRELWEQSDLEQTERRYCRRSSARENMASMRSIVANTDSSFCASVLRGPRRCLFESLAVPSI